MKKYFVVSDIHSCFDPMKKALDEVGFSLENKNHILIIAGDLFDRGDQTIQCFDFVKKLLKKQRAIWIRGNHEDLMIELLKKDFPSKVDFSNGTVKSCCAFTDIDPKTIDVNKIFVDLLFQTHTDTEEENLKLIDKASEIAQKNWKNVVGECNKLKIANFIIKNTTDFFEIDKYIIVHSFIPNDAGRFFAEWRTKASAGEWRDARWKNPFDQIDFGKFDQEAKQGKVLVFGHWFNAMARWYNKNPNQAFDFYNPSNDHSIIIDEKFIGLDACTPLSKKVNVFVIENKE